MASISGKHTEKSALKDLHQIVEQLVELDVFDDGSRTHKSFVKLKTNLIRTLPERDLKDWILNNFSKHTISYCEFEKGKINELMYASQHPQSQFL